MPTTIGPATSGGRPSRTASYPLKTTRPPVAGTKRRNEKRAAASRVSPRKRLAVIVTPGARSAWRQRERLCRADDHAVARP